MPGIREALRYRRLSRSASDTRLRPGLRSLTMYVPLFDADHPAEQSAATPAAIPSTPSDGG